MNDMQFGVFWDCVHVVWYLLISVAEEYSASILVSTKSGIKI
jgi:hypothetical protein